MMGADMRYGGWLALSVPDLTDEAAAKKATEALSKLKGIAKVAPYVKQRAIGVQFAADGKLTSKEVIEALAKAGLKAANY
jgi:copper chaperone CopZ